VSLRLGETRKTRTVLPLELELLGQQWRLVAHDIDVRNKQVGAEQKTFVLARILNAQLHQSLLGKHLKSAGGVRLEPKQLQVERTERDYQVTLNRRLTSDQIEAVVREFALTPKGGVYVIRMAERNLVEFKRDHCARPVLPDDNNELKDYVLPLFENIRPYAAR
jgi:predicted DNA-binding transcriptional regulator YafY